LNPTELEAALEIVLRLGVATVLGAILGVDRDLHRKPAGVRVLSLVCMGASAITMVSVVSVTGKEQPVGDGVLRTIQGVLSGIGFLGAGVIMRAQGKDEVHGITTAASIWISSILGMICGLGHWVLGVCVFGLAWFILIVGRWLEGQILKLVPPPVPPTPDPVPVEGAPRHDH
jgi:putative Mg2+ transporter-C (MgtC) family protein